MNWVRNATIEHHLAEIGCPFRYEPKLKFSEIDIDASRRNQSRLIGKPIISELVTQYACAMIDGYPFVPLVVWESAPGKYTIADGNNRSEAFREAKLDVRGATVGAYILETDDTARIQLAVKTLNRIANGVQQRPEEAVEHIVTLLRDNPWMTQREASKRFQIPESLITKRMRTLKIETILSERRIDTRKLTDSHLLEAGKLRNDAAIAVASQIAIDNKLTSSELRDIVQAARAEQTETAQLASLEKAAEKIESLRRPSVTRGCSPKAQFTGALHRLKSVVAKYPTNGHLMLTSKSELAATQVEWEALKEAVDEALSC